MKKIVVLFISIAILFAKTQKLSDIPPAQIFYINLDPQICDTKCLEKLIKDELYISFLTRYDEKQANEELRNFFVFLNSGSDFYNPSTAEVQIAILLPEQVIKSYSIIVANAIFSYAIKRGLSSNIEFFLSQNETSANIDSALLKARAGGFRYVIAPLTNAGLNVISDPKYSDMIFYIPTINSKTTNLAAKNLIFGGIDYEDQIKKLLSYSNQKIAVFNDGSRLGNMLNSYINNLSTPVYTKEISGNKLDLKPTLENNSRLRNSSIFLNTPLIKTALLSSQFRVFDLNPNALLSTQINYNNALLSLTQPNDRKNMYIANSISKIDDEIISNNAILGQNIEYDWVAYSSTFGFDYIYTKFINSDAISLFDEKVQDGQVIYDTKIMKSNQFGFYSLDANSKASSSSIFPTRP